VYNFITLL